MNWRGLVLQGRRQSGQVMVEFAVILPLVILVVMFGAAVAVYSVAASEFITVRMFDLQMGARNDAHEYIASHRVLEYTGRTHVWQSSPGSRSGTWVLPLRNTRGCLESVGTGGMKVYVGINCPP